MFISKSTRSIRGIALFVTLIILASALCSCSSAPIRSSKEELAVVGTVGNYEVLYEELYYLTANYRSSLEEKYGKYTTLDADTAALFEQELRETVYSNIVTNYAILELCRAEGLTLESSELDSRVQEYIDEMIESDFDGKTSNYKKNLKEYHLTDHFVRENARVDLLYSDLMTALLKKNVIADDDTEVLGKIKNEFAHTYHIAIFNDAGDDVSANRAKAEEALAKYNSGEKSMYQLIGSSYNEDLSDTTGDGYYFAKGSMDEQYETAAFALEEGQISGIVEGKGVHNGKNVSCFYIIKRLPLEDKYLEENFAELEQAYRDAVIYGMLEDKKAELTFVPNDYARSLTLSTIEAPKAYTPWAEILFISIGALAVVGGAAAITVIVIKRKRSGESK